MFFTSRILLFFIFNLISTVNARITLGLTYKICDTTSMKRIAISTEGNPYICNDNTQKWTVNVENKFLNIGDAPHPDYSLLIKILL